MADEIAKTSLTFDASGAQKGAADFRTAAGQVVAAEATVQAAAEKSASTVNAAEVKKSAARASGSKSAKDSAAVEAAATTGGADAVVAAQTRIVRSTSQQMATLDRYAKSWDPLLAAMGRAEKQFETVFDIAQKTVGAVQSRAIDMMTEAIDRLNTAQRNLSAGFDVDKRFDELQAKFDPLTASARAMANELKDLNDAQALGIISGDAYAAAQQKIIDSYDEGAQAAMKAATAQREMIETARAAQAAQSALAANPSANTLLGIKGGAAGAAEASFAVFTEAATAQETLAAEMDRLTAAFDPLSAAMKQYVSAITDIDAALALEIISQEQAAAARTKAADSYNTVVMKEATQAQAALSSELDRLTAQFKPAAAAAEQYKSALQDINAAASLGIITDQEAIVERTKLATAAQGGTGALHNFTNSAFAARFATQQLGVQTVQFFSSLEAGQPFWQAFIGQAHQVVDVSLATGTGFGVIAAGIGRMFTAVGRFVAANPLVTVFVAGTAALTTFGIMAEQTDRKILALQNTLRATRDDFTNMSSEVLKGAAQLAKATDASRTDALAALSTIAAAPQFQGTQEQLVDLGKAAQDMATVLGTTLPDAAKKVAEALQDPAKATQALIGNMKGFDQALLYQVEHLQNAGDKAGAFNVYLHAMQVATQGAVNNLTPLQKAVKDLGDEFKSSTEEGHGLFHAIGEFVTGQLADFLVETREVLRLLDNIPAWLRGGSSTSTPAVPTSVVDMVNQTALTKQFTAFQSEVFRQIIQAESQGQQFDKSGNVLTSSKGAVGLTQIMPATAAGLGFSAAQIATPSGNIAAGAAEFNHLWDKYHGDIFMILAAYNWGEGNLDKFGLAKAPAETTKYISDITTRIAASGVPIPAPTAGSAAAPIGPVTGSGAANMPPDVLNQAQEYLKTLGLVFDKQKSVADQLHDMQTAYAVSAKAGDAAKDQTERYRLGILALEGVLYQTKGPQEEFIKGWRQQAEAAQVLTPADAELADAIRQLNEISKQHPDTASDVQRGELISAVLAKQSGEYRKLSFELDLATKQQQQLTAAYGSGYAGVAEATAQTQAYNEALKIAPIGTVRFAAAVEELTAKFLKQAKAVQEGQAAQQSLQNQDTIAYIQRETDTLMTNGDARTLNLAHLKAEQDAKRNLSLTSDELRQKYIAEQDQIASMTLTLQQQQAAIAEVSGMFTSAFDTITQALLNGQGAAINWRNVMTQVSTQILQSFLKLAVLNPLLKNLFGADVPTIGSVFDTLNKETPGSTTTSGGGGSTGLIGSLISWIGSIASLSGGAPPLSEAATASVTSHLASEASFIMPTSHTGGIVGANDNSPMRLVPAAMVANAPRFHNGSSADLTAVLQHATDVMARTASVTKLQPNEMPAVLLRDERVLTAQQDNALKSMIGGMADQLAMFKGTGTDGRSFAAPPMFHDGVGGGDFSAVMQQGKQLLSSAPAAPSQASGGQQAGDTIHIAIDARGSTSDAVSSFRRSLPQIATIMSEQLARAKARNG